MSSKRLTVIGSSNVDMICQLDHLPALGETVTGGKFMQAMGGKGANQAVAAGRAGGNVRFITCLGDDAYARQCLDNFRNDGINTDSVIIRKGTHTGVALIMIDDQGRNYLAIASGANHAITPSDMDSCESAIRDSSMLLMQNEIAPEAAQRVLEIAAAANIPVIFNYAPVGSAPVPVSDKFSCLVVNETEASQLSGLQVCSREQVEKAAIRLAEMGPETVIITLGAQGSYIRRRSEQFYLPPFKVSPVDTTAAGDTYCGALAVALLEGQSLRDATIFATAASAISVTRMGAQPSIPTRQEIDAFLKERNG